MTTAKRPKITFGTLILLAAVAALFVFWYSGGILPDGSSETPLVGGMEQIESNEALMLPTADEVIVYESLTPENFLELLSTYEMPHYLVWEVRTAVYATSSALFRNAYIEITGDDYYLTLTEGEREVRTVERSGNSVTVDGYIDLRYSETYSPLLQMGMADINYLLEVPPEDIVGAGWTELDGRQVIWVELFDSLLNQSEHYWVSPEYGIPLHCETYDGDRLVYSANTVLLEGYDEAPEEGE